jgi:D-3-phosphoglycerate dehydrogenase
LPSEALPICKKGILGHLNQVFSRRDLNITARYLQTDGEIGYVVIEAEGSPEQSRETLDEIRALEGTIRARLLYAWG